MHLEKKNKRILLTAILLFCLFCDKVFAGEKKDISSRLEFSIGMITSFLIHESAHLISASLTGTPIKWEIGSYNQPIGFRESTERDTDGLIINASGLVSQIFVSELILAHPHLNTKNGYVRGMMTWNVVNSLIYAADYWIIKYANRENGNGYEGDIAGIKHYSNRETANQFALAVTLIAAFHGYRFYRKAKFEGILPEKEFHIQLEGVPDNGMAIKAVFDF